MHVRNWWRWPVGMTLWFSTGCRGGGTGCNTPSMSVIKTTTKNMLQNLEPSNSGKYISLTVMQKRKKILKHGKTNWKKNSSKSIHDLWKNSYQVTEALFLQHQWKQNTHTQAQAVQWKVLKHKNLLASQENNSNNNPKHAKHNQNSDILSFHWATTSQ